MFGDVLNAPLRRHFIHEKFMNISRDPDKTGMVRSSRPEVLLGKGVLNICSKFTGEHPCRNGYF